MSTIHLVPEDIRRSYLVKEWRNAAGVLATACPQEWADVLEVLRDFRLLRSEIQAAGKNRSPISRQIDQAFYARDWIEKKNSPRPSRSTASATKAQLISLIASKVELH